LSQKLQQRNENNWSKCLRERGDRLEFNVM
jgi:hypothetical protein